MNLMERAESIVDAALDVPSAERAAFLEEKCGEDDDLKKLINALLRAHQQAPAPEKEQLPPSPRPTIEIALKSAENPVKRIGRYKLLQQIGEGGCGVVYMAEQEEPVRRRVALKVIKVGMDTKQVIARFEAERQALAMMDHPNIAKVLDAGTSEAGSPYFVMELVRGIKITDYCDQNNLITQTRLELFMQVCKAVQHAHQKGIIHRDIKPSNILVTMHDGRPVPKVIDFGIAKAIDQPLTDKTLFTRFEQFIGTPAYMSPEQAEMTALDIDTRSDIYSLGVLLYELLTGKVPFDPSELMLRGLEEMRRIIREKDPVKPSTRLSSLNADEQTTVAKRRQLEGPRLVHLVRGDLDWIVMKCLEKDRTRRYETANGLAREIERFLQDEPVVACPPSRYYRLQKLVRRNKLSVTAAASICATLVIGLTLATWSFIKEKKARAQAIEAAADTESVMNFLENKVLAAARPEGEEGGLGHVVTVRRAIEEAEPQVAMLFSNRPVVEARIRQTLGTTFMHLTDYSNAVLQFRRALEIAQRTLSATNETTLSCMNNLGSALQSDGHLAESLPILEEAYSKAKLALGLNAELTLQTMDNLAGAYMDTHQMEKGLSMTREVESRAKSKYGEKDPRALQFQDNLGVALQNSGAYKEAIAVLERSLERYRSVMGTNHPGALRSMQNLADVYRNDGRFAEALALHTNAYSLSLTKLGTNNEATQKILNNIGLDYLAGGRPAEAIPWFEQALKAHEAQFGEAHEITLTMMNNLASAYDETGAREKGLPLLEKVVRISKANNYPVSSATLNNLAVNYFSNARTQESLATFEEAEKAAREQSGPDNPETLITMQSHAATLRDAGLVSNAISLFTKTLELQRRKIGEEHIDTMWTKIGLAACYTETRRYAEARLLLTQVLATERKRADTSVSEEARTLQELAICALGQADCKQAELLIQESLSILKKEPPEDWRTYELLSLLGECRMEEGKIAEAEEILTSAGSKLLEQTEQLSAKRKVVVNKAVQRVIRYYSLNSKPEQADFWRNRLVAPPRP